MDTVLNAALNIAPDLDPTFLKDIPNDARHKSRKPSIQQ